MVILEPHAFPASYDLSLAFAAPAVLQIGQEKEAMVQVDVKGSSEVRITWTLLLTLILLIRCS